MKEYQKRNPSTIFIISGRLENYSITEQNKIWMKNPFVYYSEKLTREEVYSVWNKSKFAIILRGGYSLLEAAYMSTCIVTYNTDWHSEVINKESGIIADINNINFVVNKMQMLKENDILLEKITRNAKSISESLSNREIVFKKTYNLYLNCIRDFSFKQEE